MNQREKRFVKVVWDYYYAHGRHDLPWRKNTKPYKILVSEIMLQQTQVSRVVPKYKSFLKKFSNAKQLAFAPLGDVLKAWQGLGYNRRAKFLHECAKEIVKNYKGRFPKTKEKLLNLPGVGDYTAGAIMAFSYNKSAAMIETNIRSVYLHHFFQNKTDITDKEILTLVEKTSDKENPREWYWALMDYGSHLKQTTGNQNKRSKHYNKQSKFKGSDREIRGAILRQLSEGEATYKKLCTALGFETERIKVQLKKLKEEGLIKKQKHFFLLP